MSGYADTVLIPAMRAAGLTVVDLRAWLPRNTNPAWPNAREWSQRPPEALTIFCWHYDALPLRPEGNYDARARYAAEARDHIARDWGNGWHAPTIAYHLKVAGDGTVYVLNEVEDVTWNANDANGQDFAICLDLGEGQAPTPAQLAAAQTLADVLSTQTPDIPADQGDHYGHGELTAFNNATSCPGALLPYVQRYRATGRMVPGATPPQEIDPMPDLTPYQVDMLSLMEPPLSLNADSVRQLVSDRAALAEQADLLRKELVDATKEQLAQVPPPVQSAPPPTVTSVALAVRVTFSDGRAVEVPVGQGVPSDA